MSSHESSGVADLFRAIAALRPRAIGFTGVIVRSAAVRYASENDFLSGAGSARYGGRWNRRRIRAVYASLDVLTATREAYQNILDFGFPLDAIHPRVIAAARVRLQLVLDLSAASVRREIGFTRKELLSEDWHSLQGAGEESWTQVIGRGCRRAGFEAMLAPSARNSAGRNIVIFPDRLQAGSALQIIGADELPE